MKRTITAGLCAVLLLALCFLAPAKQEVRHVQGSVKCDYCSCVFTDDQAGPGDESEPDPTESAESTDEREEIKLATADDNRNRHLVHIVDCDNSGYWVTCEHQLEAALLQGQMPKTKWVSCPGRPDNCGEAPTKREAYWPTVRHVGERLSGAGEDE